MERRNFLRNSSIVALGASLLQPLQVLAGSKDKATKGKVKNIIFMVSDGMSSGTLAMANIMRKYETGKSSHWIRLYEEQLVARALMDTSSASSWITDSAAASSAWGGGKKVANGAINTNEDGTHNTPILRKMKNAGKAIGCVTTVPVTHATPAGFCVATKKRNNQDLIAEMILELQPDVMLGGGLQYFSHKQRKDGKNMLTAYRTKGYQIVQNKKELLNAQPQQPILGLFAEDGLPYTVDAIHDNKTQASTPTLAEMTTIALQNLKQNPNGFMLQVEAGKVDWAAHANDISALIYDQLAFDDAIKVAVDFALNNEDTLVVITTDHGNSNPALNYGKKADEEFQKISKFKHSNDWILNGITPDFSKQQVINRIKEATTIEITTDEAEVLLKYYGDLSEEGIYNYKKLPYKALSEIIGAHTSTSFAAMVHSSDHVELALFGKGKEHLPAFIQNNELHFLLLELTGIKS